MKIGFIAEPYEESNASGMGYLVLELMKNFLAEGSQHQFTFYSSRPISTEILTAPFRNVLVPRNFIKKFFWFLILREDIDVLFFVAPLLPLWISKRIKTIIICQELASQKIRPKQFADKIVAIIRDQVLMPLCISRACKIIVPSKATKEDVLRFYNVALDKITLVYNGFQELRPTEHNTISLEANMKPFFFFAGKIKFRKNVHGIVSAFILFKKKTHVDCKLVIAGDSGGEYCHTIVQELEKNGLAHEVFFVGYVSKAMLYALYANACAFVFPSLNEGFGMPILEAMSLETPVITSKISSMAEIAGDATLLVNPFDIEDISNAMEKVFFNSELRTKLIQKGFQRAKLFSWQKAVREYLALAQTLK